MSQPEQRARDHARHIALRVTKRGDIFFLRERYGDKKKIGDPYRSVDSLRRAIWRQHHC
jgi:hypothetical protein